MFKNASLLNFEKNSVSPKFSFVYSFTFPKNLRKFKYHGSSRRYDPVALTDTCPCFFLLESRPSGATRAADIGRR